MRSRQLHLSGNHTDSVGRVVIDHLDFVLGISPIKRHAHASGGIRMHIRRELRILLQGMLLVTRELQHADASTTVLKRLATLEQFHDERLVGLECPVTFLCARKLVARLHHRT